MIFKNIIFRQGSITIINALKGQNHQHRATPCDWMTEPSQALKGRQQTRFRLAPFQGCATISVIYHRDKSLRWDISPFQGSNSHVCPSLRALPDAIAKRLSALTSCVCFLFRKMKASILRLRSAGQSRRDNTLLTVGFNLRTMDAAHTLSSPAWDDTLLYRKMQVSSHAGLGRDRMHSVSTFRRLKPTVNKVLSLRDKCLFKKYVQKLSVKPYKSNELLQSF